MLSAAFPHAGEAGRRQGGAVLRPARWREAGAPVGAAQGHAEAARGVQQHAGGGMARERARKRRKRDGTRRARASVSRGESILIPRLEGEGSEGRIDVQPEFRRSLMEAGGTGADFRPR